MAKLQRKSAKLFAEDATAAAGGLAQFGSLAAGTPNYSTDPDVIQALDAYKEGWSSAVLGTKSPALEDRNALDYLLSYQQAYIMQRGIPEYLDTETYYQGSFASLSDGRLYVSKVDNNTGHNPANDTTETYWLKFPTPAEMANYVLKAGDTMTGNLTLSKSAPTLSLANTSNSTTYKVNVDDTTGKLNLINNSTNAGVVIDSASSDEPFYTNGTNTYPLQYRTEKTSTTGNASVKLTDVQFCWGSFTCGADSSVRINFATPFVNEYYCVCVTYTSNPNVAGNKRETGWVSDQTTTGFTYNSNNEVSAANYSYIAINFA